MSDDALTATGRQDAGQVGDLCLGGERREGLENAGRDAGAPCAHGCGPVPVSVCPSEWVAAEATLLRMLKRHYGWIQPEAGVLMRGRLAR
jgi:hypothetical protein